MAQVFNRFYLAHRVINEDKGVENARLARQNSGEYPSKEVLPLGIAIENVKQRRPFDVAPFL
ncbi:MAG: hypothetical protein ACLTSK_00495 [Christensenellales bacterium]